MPTVDDRSAQTGDLHILIIEDSDTDYLLLERYLSKLWPECVRRRAADRAGLAAALSQPWNLIITDYHLTDIEGDELISTIAAQHSRTPCILLSGSLDELREIKAPANFFCRLEKGDRAGLAIALQSDWAL